MLDARTQRTLGISSFAHGQPKTYLSSREPFARYRNRRDEGGEGCMAHNPTPEGSGSGGAVAYPEKRQAPLDITIYA